MNSVTYDKLEGDLLKSVQEVLSVMVHETPLIADDEMDFFPGQRFCMEVYAPRPMVFFLEVSLPLKKEIIQRVFQSSWEEVPHSLRDDCFLEITDNLIQRFLVNSYSDHENMRVRLSSPLVIFDEYEDDLEVGTMDLFRFDYQLWRHPFSLIVSLEGQPD